MKDLYYTLWVDAIVKTRENPLSKNDWKWILQLSIGAFMALNLSTFLFFLAIIGITDKMLMLEFNIIQIKKLIVF